MMRLTGIQLFIIIMIWAPLAMQSQVFQNDCKPDTIVIDTMGKEINWQQFPDFELPFTVVYHGDAPSDSIAWPLRKGFTHITGRGIHYLDTIWPEYRSYTWTGIANADNWALETRQPWRMIKSPWENDIEGYRDKWDHRLNVITSPSRYKYQPPDGHAKLDLIIADLEWAHHNDAGILAIKADTLIPEYYQGLSDSAFIAEYKTAMSLLYAEPLYLARDSFNTSITLGSYAEVPIRRTWHTIDDTTWVAWTGDSSNVDYLMQDTSGFMNSNFYNFHDIISPSVYYFYNVDSIATGKKYLAYNLFQSEVNSAWSDKEQLVYCWLNYHSGSSYTEAIKPWMAEATAIFPLMTGISGLYPWKPATPYGYDVYEYFIKGLYRLSQFNDMFDGNEQYIIPMPAHESFVNDLPIWRAVVNGNYMLIAAHNPYADEGDTTLIPVSYGNWTDTVGLIGTEVFLCKFIISSVGINEIVRADDILVYPNPTRGLVKISADVSINGIRIIDQSSKILNIESYNQENPEIRLKGLPAGFYILELSTKDRVYYKKVLLIND